MWRLCVILLTCSNVVVAARRWSGEYCCRTRRQSLISTRGQSAKGNTHTETHEHTYTALVCIESKAGRYSVLSFNVLGSKNVKPWHPSFWFPVYWHLDAHAAGMGCDWPIAGGGFRGGRPGSRRSPSLQTDWKLWGKVGQQHW